jgi:hypothetical protein
MPRPGRPPLGPVQQGLRGQGRVARGQAQDRHRQPGRLLEQGRAGFRLRGWPGAGSPRRRACSSSAIQAMASRPSGSKGSHPPAGPGQDRVHGHRHVGPAEGLGGGGQHGRGGRPGSPGPRRPPGPPPAPPVGRGASRANGMDSAPATSRIQPRSAAVSALEQDAVGPFHFEPAGPIRGRPSKPPATRPAWTCTTG